MKYILLCENYSQVSLLQNVFLNEFLKLLFRLNRDCWDLLIITGHFLLCMRKHFRRGLILIIMPYFKTSLGNVILTYLSSKKFFVASYFLKKYFLVQNDFISNHFLFLYSNLYSIYTFKWKLVEVVWLSYLFVWLY